MSRCYQRFISKGNVTKEMAINFAQTSPLNAGVKVRNGLFFFFIPRLLASYKYMINYLSHISNDGEKHRFDVQRGNTAKRKEWIFLSYITFASNNLLHCIRLHCFRHGCIGMGENQYLLFSFSH